MPQLVIGQMKCIENRIKRGRLSVAIALDILPALRKYTAIRVKMTK
jgi:hypothetical protein